MSDPAEALKKRARATIADVLEDRGFSGSTQAAHGFPTLMEACLEIYGRAHRDGKTDYQNEIGLRVGELGPSTAVAFQANRSQAEGGVVALGVGPRRAGSEAERIAYVLGLVQVVRRAASDGEGEVALADCLKIIDLAGLLR